MDDGNVSIGCKLHNSDIFTILKKKEKETVSSF